MVRPRVRAVPRAHERRVVRVLEHGHREEAQLGVSRAVGSRRPRAACRATRSSSACRRWPCDPDTTRGSARGPRVSLVEDHVDVARPRRPTRVARSGRPWARARRGTRPRLSRARARGAPKRRPAPSAPVRPNASPRCGGRTQSRPGGGSGPGCVAPRRRRGTNLAEPIDGRRFPQHLGHVGARAARRRRALDHPRLECVELRRPPRRPRHPSPRRSRGTPPRYRSAFDWPALGSTRPPTVAAEGRRLGAHGDDG